MADLFELEIITPERKFYAGNASMVEFTTTEGDIGVYKNHIPLTAVIAPGVLKIHEEDGVKEAALLSGFAQILPEKIVIVAEVAEWPEEIDENRAKEAKIRAERRLKEQNGEIDVVRVEAALKRALVRLSLMR